MKFLAAVLLTNASLCHASEWTIVPSQHFDLYTSGNPQAGRDTVVFFEQVHDLFASWNAKEPASAPKVRIVNFQSEQEYRFYQPNQMAAAFFLSGPPGDFIVTRTLTPQSYPVAVHEYVHLVVKRSGYRTPPAMNEGLAEFYSTLKVTKAGIEIGTPPLSRLFTLRISQLFPLRFLFAINVQSPVYRNREQLDAFYAESWALTHMLLLSPEYRDKTTSYIREMQAPPDPLTSLERITGKSGADILSDLHKYVRKDRFVTAILDGRWDDRRPAPEARPASRAESDTALADLLKCEGRLTNRQ